MKAKVYSILLVALMSSGLFAAGCDSLKGTDGTKGPAGPEGPTGLPCPTGQKCIDGAWIQDGTVVNAAIAPGSISTGDLLDGAVTTAKIADHAVTDAKILSIDPIKIDPAFLHTLDFAVFSAYGDLGNEGYLGNLHGYDLLTRDQSDVRYLQEHRVGNLALANLPGNEAVNTENIRDGAITSAKLSASLSVPVGPNSVSTGNIVDDQVFDVDLRKVAGQEAVTTFTIRDAAVTNVKLAPGIDGAKLTNGTIGTNQITDGGVGTIDLANNSVTTAKILDQTITSNDLERNDPAALPPTLGAIAAINIQDDAVTTSKILNGTITSADLQDYAGAGTGAVATIDIQNGAVTDAKINDVAATKITGTIGTAQIANLAVTDAKINDVASTKITGTIATAQIANLAVTDAKINDVAAGKITGTISTAQIANLAVTDAKINDVAAGKITGTISSAQITDGTIISADLQDNTGPGTGAVDNIDIRDNAVSQVWAAPTGAIAPALKNDNVEVALPDMQIDLTGWRGGAYLVVFNGSFLSLGPGDASVFVRIQVDTGTGSYQDRAICLSPGKIGLPDMACSLTWIEPSIAGGGGPTPKVRVTWKALGTAPTIQSLPDRTLRVVELAR